MPGPASATSTRTAPGSSTTTSHTGVPAGVCRTALEVRPDEGLGQPVAVHR